MYTNKTENKETLQQKWALLQKSVTEERIVVGEREGKNCLIPAVLQSILRLSFLKPISDLEEMNRRGLMSTVCCSKWMGMTQSFPGYYYIGHMTYFKC
jgi:hypothetical protein